MGSAVIVLNKIFKVLGVKKVYGYIATLLILDLVFFGGLYATNYMHNLFVRERFTTESMELSKIEAEKFVRKGKYLDRIENEKEIRKVINRISSELSIYLDLPQPIGSTSVPKIDFDDITDRLNLAINENTYNFSPGLRSNMIQVRHLLNYIKLQDEVLLGILTETPIDGEKYRVVANSIQKKFNHTFPSLKTSIELELDNIKY